MKKNYTVHPFDDLKNKNCPWIEEVKTCVESSIKDYDAYIQKLAEAEHSVDLADEDKLYKCFKDNVANQMEYGNMTVLKFYILHFERKILYNMIGKFKFTDRDVEMLNYFRTHEVDKSISNKQIIKFRYIGRMPGFVGDLECAKNWTMTVKYNGYFNKVNYTDFFIKQYVICNEMTRKSKNLYPLCNDDLFGTNMFVLYGDTVAYNDYTIFKFN